MPVCKPFTPADLVRGGGDGISAMTNCRRETGELAGPETMLIDAEGSYLRVKRLAGNAQLGRGSRRTSDTAPTVGQCGLNQLTLAIGDGRRQRGAGWCGPMGITLQP